MATVKFAIWIIENVSLSDAELVTVTLVSADRKIHLSPYI
jgi:hypothetical protein